MGSLRIDGSGLEFAISPRDMKQRTILVILSNRLDRNQKIRFIEIDCDDKGNILKERPLRSEPKESRFDEVWENDEGKPDMSTCHRFKRKYGHRLQKKAK
jgi:hypothetical protein